MIYTDQEFLYRNSPIGDGTGTITKIKGNSLVFSQLVQNGNFTSTSSWTNTYTSSFTASDNVASFVATQQNGRIAQTIYGVVNNHTYLVTAAIKISSGYARMQMTSNPALQVDTTVTGSFQTLSLLYKSTATEKKSLEIRDRRTSGWSAVEVKNVMVFDLTMLGLDSLTLEEVKQWFSDYYPLEYYDCTSQNLLSFSVPYRPSNISGMTFDVTKAVRVHSGTSYEWTFDSFTNATSWRVALTCFDINGNRIYTGSDISSVSGLTSLPANASNSYYLNGGNNTSLAHGFVSNFDGYIMPFFMLGDTSASSVMNNANIHSLNSGDFNILLSFNGTDLKTQSEDESQSDTLTLPISTYFPTGMKSAGSVYDELTPSKAYTRIGSVDLGTLYWAYSTNSSGVGVFTAYPTGISLGVLGINTLKCDKYLSIPCINANVAPASVFLDKAICQSIGGYSLRVRDDDYTDVATFTNAVSGKYLYYELLTLSEVDISPSLDLTYTTYRNGTEQILPVNTSVPTIAPIICDIEYLPIEWIAPIYDRTQEDIINKTPKAYLNIGDMNRIQNDIKFLSAYYNISVLPKTWAYTDIPTVEAFSTILTYLNNIKNKVADSPNLPSNPILTFEQINQIEYFLNFVYEYYRQRIQIISQPVSGCYRAGEPNLLIA